MAPTQKTIRIPMATIYCKSRPKGSATEVCVGLEITEAAKRSSDPADLVRAEGRVALRFFNTSLPKERQVRTLLEPWEAFDMALKIQQAVLSKTPIELKMAPHKFVKANQEILTTLVVEKWLRGDRSGYAIKALRKGAMHNVSMNETNIRYAAEVLKHFSLSQAWVEKVEREPRAEATAPRPSAGASPARPTGPARPGPAPVSPPSMATEPSTTPSRPPVAAAPAAASKPAPARTVPPAPSRPTSAAGHTTHTPR